MATIIEQLKVLIKPTVESMGFEFWGLVYQTQSGRAALRVFIESSEGVPIDACEKVSRQIASILDTEDLIHQAYILEVSSPGMDRLLFELDHYRRVIGKDVKVKVFEPVEGRRNFVGKLVEVSNQGSVSFLVEEKPIVFSVEKIQSAQVQPDFSKPKKPVKKTAKRGE